MRPLRHISSHYCLLLKWMFLHHIERLSLIFYAWNCQIVTFIRAMTTLNFWSFLLTMPLILRNLRSLQNKHDHYWKICYLDFLKTQNYSNLIFLFLVLYVLAITSINRRVAKLHVIYSNLYFSIQHLCNN